MFFILVIILLLTLFYFYCIKPLTFWRENGVQQENLPQAVCDSLFFFLQRRELTTIINEWYKRFPGHRYYGMYQFGGQSLLIKNADLIKQMVIKDFEYFNAHREVVPKDVDPLFGKNLFVLKGNEWRNMRSTLSPSFTSSKMKGIFLLMDDYSQKFVDYFLNKNDNLMEIEMKNVTSKFCNDVIASSAFGTVVDSFNNPDNEFFKNGQKITDFRQWSLKLRLAICMIFPSIAKMFNVKFFDDETGEFFTRLIDDTIKFRKETGTIRPDMVQLLMEAQEGNFTKEEQIADTGFATVEEHLKGSINHNIITEDIVAQALLFFFAGFDSVSTLMCFLAYELCVNQHIQTRLREEIEETLENCNEKINYEALVNMKYMDMVVSEALRKWPTQPAMERFCTKPYTIQPVLPHEKPVEIKVGQSISLPIYAIHHDPNNFPDPETFDPERFSDENKTNIKPYTYQPFGLGPRNCIGSRFALLETKIMFFYLLHHFKIVPITKTEIPIKMTKGLFSMLPSKGFWMGFERIREVTLS